MKKSLLPTILILLLLAACGPDPIPNRVPGPTFPPPTQAAQISTSAPAADTAPTDTAGSDTSATPTDAPAPERVFSDRNIEPPGLVQDATDLVSGSGNCAVCHAGLRSDDGEELSFDALWRASMMAHAAKDPYWQASVSSETAEFPELAEVIADKCSVCHMPLARFDAVANDETPLVLGEGFLNPANRLHDLAMDGVSCTLCHQIEPDNFGEKDSFSGHYLINTEDRGFGDRRAYGPLPISESNAQIMQSASGYLGVQAEHMTESDLCGTCHNLYTPFLDANNEIAGEFPEQTAHLEWQNSDYAGGACGDCHMPTVNDVLISNLSTERQAYLAKHTFAGANAFMLKLLRANAEETGITAEEAQMTAAIDRILEQLSALPNTSVQMGDVSLDGGVLTAEVTVSNPNGHKRPTSFPSRRAWIHMWVTDGNGEVIFESGAVDERGFISENDNDLDASLYEPHYDQIDSPEQVQIYEAIMGNTEGEVTTTLLRAAEYLKDNRVLPAGFPADPPADIAVYGAALDDTNFVAGSDTVTYIIEVGEAPGPYTLHFELLYQTIAYRWAENLRGYGTAQTEEFFSYYDDADLTPVVLGTTQHFEE